jgi:hypothetical protein
MMVYSALEWSTPITVVYSALEWSTPITVVYSALEWSTPSMAKLRQNAEAILNTFAVFIFGVTHYITNLFSKYIQKIVAP